MVFDWDAANIDHIARHGITPEQVEQVFAKQTSHEKTMANQNGEERFIVEGRDDEGRALVVIATMRGERIRPITAYQVHRRILRKRNRP